jgi:hypothetical protein
MLELTKSRQSKGQKSVTLIQAMAAETHRKSKAEEKLP